MIMKQNIHIFLNTFVIAGLLLSECISHTSGSPKRGISLPKRSYMIPHISTSMATSNLRKASASQQNFRGQLTRTRSHYKTQNQKDLIADNMNLKLATTALDAAIEESGKFNLNMNIAILDSGGNLVSFARMDDSYLGSIDVAMKKAKTSVLFKAPSEALGNGSQPGGAIYGVEQTNGGLVTFAGGMPIFSNEKLIGAIGVSGANDPADDKKIAEAGLKSIQ